jgi:hypothetical protein
MLGGVREIDRAVFSKGQAAWGGLDAVNWSW